MLRPFTVQFTMKCFNTKSIRSLSFSGENDKCLIKEPCVHGQCVQVNLDGKRKWQCACAGTGFFGRKCEEGMCKIPQDARSPSTLVSSSIPFVIYSFLVSPYNKCFAQFIITCSGFPPKNRSNIFTL